MNIGFHFHTPSSFDRSGRVLAPAFFGVFIEELAKVAGSVTYYTFSGPTTGREDFALLPPRIRCVDLGPRPRAPVILARPGPLLRKIDFDRDRLDVLVVRGPGPLLPALLRKARRKSLPAAAMIGGDYRSWRPWSVNPFWRNQLIRLYMQTYTVQQRRALRGALTLACNPWIEQMSGGDTTAGSHLEFTTWITSATLEEIDNRRSERPAWDRSRRARLLYTGRIVEEKGVPLIVEALGLLVSRGIDAELELVGWSPPGDPTPRMIEDTAIRCGVKDRVAFAGYQRAGTELLGRYLEADVLVTASPTEWGFPQTVLEAMAARVPVVATEIEGFRGALTNGEHAILVPPGSAEALADGIERVLTDRALSERLTDAARAFAAVHTIDRSVALTFERIRVWADLVAAQDVR